MLKQQEIQPGMKPFDHIICPVCGAEEFVELVPAGGVWCAGCNARFSCRDTAGDPGLVVDCSITEVWRGSTVDHHVALYQMARKVLIRGDWRYGDADNLHRLERLWVTRQWPERLPISFYQVCKEPQPDGSWSDCRCWNITSTSPEFKLFASIGPGTRQRQHEKPANPG